MYTPWFPARSRDKRNKSRPFRLGGRQFVQRWSQHILPKGFTKSRSYGGYHNTKRAEYLALCIKLLPATAISQPPPVSTPPPEDIAAVQPARKCPHCQADLTLTAQPSRFSWRQVLAGPDRPHWYHAFTSSHRAAMQGNRNGY